MQYTKLFTQGSNPPVAGACDALCDPLLDNDFDGLGSALNGPQSVKRSDSCRDQPEYGCYGTPKNKPPATRFSCARDLNYNKTGPANMVHRTQCTDSNNCTDDSGATKFNNGCNQGYLPLLDEATDVTTLICVAMCKPTECYMGNCGGGAEVARLGIANDSCKPADRLGTFDNTFNEAGHGEHCVYNWWFEIDRDTDKYLPSPHSDTVGYCFDHNKYRWDDDGDPSTPPVLRPPCASLPDGLGTDAAPGAGAFGCVPTSHVSLMTATGKVPALLSKVMRRAELPRPPYNSMMR